MVAFVVRVALCLAPALLPAQQDSTLARVRSQSVDSLPGPIPTYFSPGYRVRAESLQALLRRMSDHLSPRLGKPPAVWLAVLDETHWKGLRRRGPYGSPFSSPPPRVIGLPAVPESSLVTKVFRSLHAAAPPDGLDTLRRIRRSYDESALAAVDWFGLHELGHALADQWGADGEARWLHEFLATYLAYSYLADNDRNVMAAWNVLSRSFIKGITPAYRTLDDFNRPDRPLAAAAPESYGWFQSQFTILATDILRQRGGTDLFNRMRAAGLDVGSANLPTPELLARLDQIIPGFRRWAAALASADSSARY